MSYIDTSLANELRLPELKEEKLRLHTFGSDQVQEKICRLVQLNAWDAEGVPIKLDLLTHNVITKSFRSPALSNDDADFIRQYHIPFKDKGENMATQNLDQDLAYLTIIMKQKSTSEKRILLISRLLCAAGIAREKYLALCTRYALIYKFYDIPWGTEKGKAGQIEAIDDEMLVMDCQTKSIDSLIAKLEKEEGKIGRDLRKSVDVKMELQKRNIQCLQNKLMEKEKEIFELKVKISCWKSQVRRISKEATSQTEDAVKHDCDTQTAMHNEEEEVKYNEILDVNELVESEEIYVDMESEYEYPDDESYFSNMVNEVKEVKAVKHTLESKVQQENTEACTSIQVP
ncbi:unnamed protein product [Strongylus vulgaris]|uniref:Uncharacterized protein n=1 Tax=Strongylus vulgaris TaxID=40348 RepID=A0A3P7LUP4_STRVU|nr:unnamed protein product [Strongylus vulgaris]